MVKNLVVSTEKVIKIEKKLVHNLVMMLKSELDFTISSLEINFVSSEFIHKVNVEYLEHDFSTDIITFNYSGEHKDLEGELFISIGDAIENAKKFNVHLDSEITRLIIHGILHLLDYDDMIEKDRVVMKEMEDKLVAKYDKSFRNYLIAYDC